MKRKKVLNIIIISCICIFLFCLYFSKTINNMLLPKVVTVKIADGAIGDNSDSAKRYKNVVPKSCLTTEDGIDYIYIVTFKDGAVNSGAYAKKVQVKVVADDKTNCSIKSSDSDLSSSYGAIVSTSKPIDNNCQVKLSIDN